MTSDEKNVREREKAIHAARLQALIAAREAAVTSDKPITAACMAYEATMKEAGFVMRRVEPDEETSDE